MVERAYRLDAENYMVQRLRAYVYFYTLSAYEFMQALDLALETNPYISTNGEVAPHCAFAGQTDRAMAMFERARQLNPHILGHYYFAPFMVYAYRAEHEKALSFAKQIRIPPFVSTSWPEPLPWATWVARKRPALL